MVNLGLRSDVPKAEAEKPKIANNEAYISVEVDVKGDRAGKPFAVDTAYRFAPGAIVDFFVKL